MFSCFVFYPGLVHLDTLRCDFCVFLSLRFDKSKLKAKVSPNRKMGHSQAFRIACLNKIKINPKINKLPIVSLSELARAKFILDLQANLSVSLVTQQGH